MVRYLYLLRHAKSSWDEPGIDDRERPLASRGKKAAKAMARHLRGEGVHPDLVLCSSAKRARQTLERVRDSLGEDTSIEVEDGLYTFDADTVLGRLRTLPASATSVMVVGHNPAMEDLVEGLTGQAVAFPTGALATLAIPVAWSRLRADGNADLASFVAPRDLPGTKR
jgi:phosphohistidine phosphatase